MTSFEGEDGKPSPILLVAVTLKVYDVPFVSPVTVATSSEVDQLRESSLVAVAPPGLAVTV